MAIFLSLLLCSAIGAVLGRTVSKGLAGAVLGLFLGPLGWIIVFLLPRDQSQPQQTPSEEKDKAETITAPETRDLSDDAYKLFLTKKYAIERNDVFQKFVCKEKMFDSVEDALEFADGLEKHPPTLSDAPPFEEAKQNLLKDGYKISGGPDTFRVIDPNNSPSILTEDQIRMLSITC